jgi:hypothetical protein
LAVSIFSKVATEKFTSPFQIVIVLLNLSALRTNNAAGRACNPSLLTISTSLRMQFKVTLLGNTTGGCGHLGNNQHLEYTTFAGKFFARVIERHDADDRHRACRPFIAAKHAQCSTLWSVAGFEVLAKILRFTPDFREENACLVAQDMVPSPCVRGTAAVAEDEATQARDGRALCLRPDRY